MGTLTRSNGVVYEGQYENGQKHGQVIMRFNYGAVYEGQCKNGEMDGQGICAFGDIYKGEWKKGKMDGWGTYLYATCGSNYIGGWKDHKKHGHGEMKLADGTVLKGNWDGDDVYKSCALM